MNTSTLFAEIVKIDKKHRMVYGYASTGSRDSQGEIITPDAMKAAMPNYLKFGNIREMHLPRAAGVVKEHTFNENGTYIGAKIIDRDAWEKVEEGVYKGFSIGGRVTKRDETDDTIVTGIELVEISLVDRPANPNALFDVIKSHGDPNALEKVEGTDGEPVEVPPAPTEIETEEQAVEDTGGPNDDPGTQVEGEAVPPASTDGVGGSQINTKADEVAKSDAPEWEGIKFSLLGEVYKHYGVTAENAEADDKRGDVAKAVRTSLDLIAKTKMSGANADSLQAIHDHTARMGAACADDKKSDMAEMLKALTPGDLSKAVAELTEVKKTLCAREETIATLNKTIEEFKKQPVAKQPGLKVVSKGQDFDVLADTTDDEALAKMNPMDRSLHEIKKAHTSPLSR